MKIQYHILHETSYSYAQPVSLSQQLLHKSPRDFYAQTCISHHIQVSPQPSESSRRLDYFGNISHYLALFTPHRELRVRAESQVMLHHRAHADDMQNSLPWETVARMLALEYQSHLEALIYLYTSPHVECSDALADYAALSFTPGRPLLEAALDLTQRIYQEFEFDTLATDVATPLSAVLAGKRGVCQDFAHLMIGCLRSLGLSCRYVSGYILTRRPEGGDDLIGGDASHAWVSVYSPLYGWVDFDPTNNCLVQYEHITIAWGRDFSDVSPMHGVLLGGGLQTLEVDVTVTQLNELVHQQQLLGI